MSKIIVYRTHIEITDYNLGDCHPIEKTFSVYNPTYHRYYPKGRLYDANRRVLMLPRGIDIGYLERVLNIEPIIDSSVDPIGDINPVMLKYKPRDEVQMEAIKFMLSMDKYSHNETHTMLSVNLNTGKGKSYCSIAAFAYLGLRPIIIADQKSWLNQWINYILEYTDIKKEEIYLISGTPSMMKLFNRDINRYKVILSTHATIQSVGSSQGWERITEFFRYCQIGIKIYDEAHLDFDNMFQIDCYTNTFITYYVTATPGQSDYRNDIIYQLYFKNVPSIVLFDEDQDPHTKYAAIRFNSNPTPIDVSKCRNGYGLNRPEYTNYLVRTEAFRQLLQILVMKAISKPGKSLFYIGTNEAILYVRDLIYIDFPGLINQVGVYTSIVPNEQKPFELAKKIILTTTKSAGASMDIKGLVETVNLAEPFKSKVLAQQTFGRTRDDGTIYKDVVDTGFLQTKKFYEAKKPVFKKYATECVEVNLNRESLEQSANNSMSNYNALIQPMDFFSHDAIES